MGARRLGVDGSGAKWGGVERKECGGGGGGGVRELPLGHPMVPSSFCLPWQADPQAQGCQTALPSLLERPSSAAAVVGL